MKAFVLCMIFTVFVLGSVLSADAQPSWISNSPPQPPGRHGSMASGQGLAPGGGYVQIPTRWGPIVVPAGTPVYYRAGGLLRRPRVMIGNPQQRRGLLPWVFGR